MKHLSRPLIIITLGLLTLLLLLKLGNIDISMDTLRRIKPIYLAAAIAIHYSGFAMRGWRWQKLLKGLGHSVGYVYAVTLLLAGWFVSALIPARLGDVARAYLLRRDHRISMAQGLGSIATERAFDILSILILAASAAALALTGRTPLWVWRTIGGGTLLLGILIAILLLSPQLEGFFLELLPWSIYKKIIRFGFELLNSIRQVGKNPRLLLLVTAQSLYIWLCDIFLMVFVFRSFGASVPFSVSAFTAMVVDLAAAVPIIPGALGQVEGTAIGVLSLFQIPAEQSALMVLLTRFISFWTFILVSGAVTYLFGFSQALNPDKLEQAKDKVD